MQRCITRVAQSSLLIRRLSQMPFLVFSRGTFRPESAVNFFDAAPINQSQDKPSSAARASFFRDENWDRYPAPFRGDPRRIMWWIDFIAKLTKRWGRPCRLPGDAGHIKLAPCYPLTFETGTSCLESTRGIRIDSNKGPEWPAKAGLTSSPA